jgi:aspartyl-tRNA(Asn)/glutamyl-tRNA(Gln) amidotransferase subunit B
LPPLVIADEWVARVRSEMTELPRVMAARFVAEYGLSEYDVTQLTQSKAVAAYFEEAAKASRQAKLACNWVTGEIARRLNAQELSIEESPVSAIQLAGLLIPIAEGTIQNNVAKKLFASLWETPGSALAFGSLAPIKLSAATGSASIDAAVDVVKALIDSLGLNQMSDTGELEAIIDTVLASNAKSIEEYKAGNAKAFNALVGQAMKATKGKGNPAQVNELLKRKLG